MRHPKTISSGAAEVVASGNCSGCGLCSLLDPSLEMALDGEGFSRPASTGGASIARGEAAYDAFSQGCPGRKVISPREERPERDPLFGSFHSVWEAWATDEETRHAGSSGGTITALAAWLVETGRAAQVTGVQAKPERPSRTIPVTIGSRAGLMKSAGSRYAPVSALDNPNVILPGSAVVGKPCEASAIRVASDLLLPEANRPIILSFFCAGVPSQLATDSLVRSFGLDPESLASMRYRGDGWPGDFVATDHVGETGRMPYDESWGKVLGPTMQWRCKICVDGVGESADIVAGDFWRSDERGYPIFDDGNGISVLIARTARGHKILTEARSDGVLTASALDITKLYSVQPFQVERRQTLFGRLLGARLAGARVPRYKGFGLLALGLTRPYRRLIRPTLGSFVRTRRRRHRLLNGKGGA